MGNLSTDYSPKDYLTSHRLSIKEKQLLFKLGTGMIDVKANYPNMYKGELSCTLCDSNSMENQQQIPSLIGYSGEQTRYAEIFSENIEKQIEAVKHWNTILKI